MWIKYHYNENTFAFENILILQYLTKEYDFNVGMVEIIKAPKELDIVNLLRC